MPTITGAEWRFRVEDLSVAEGLMRELGIGSMLARMLVARDITDRVDAYRYLNPNLRMSHDPSLMLDMDKGACRIMEAIRDRERIMVHGDYDCDGITSTALMVKVLRSEGADVLPYLPSRSEEGYGLSQKAVTHASKEAVSLILTVDCGIKAVEQVLTATELGIDTVITDHHEQGSTIPRASAVIDPKREECPYPFKELAGVGVAFKLASRLSQIGAVAMDVREQLDLVAIGTTADIVPLVDENRILVHEGLKVLTDTDSPGLRALMRESSLDPFLGLKASDIAYKLAPRLNAVGRLGDPAMALDLFLTDDRVEADLFSREINSINFRRKAIGNRVYESAISMVEEQDMWSDPALVLAGPEWHPGVIGIAASRICDETGRPTFVISIDEGGSRGSARSPEGVDVVVLLETASDLLSEYGGHGNAAGFNIPAENIEQFRERMISLMGTIYPGDLPVPYRTVDLLVGPSDLTIEGVEELSAMEPTGSANDGNVVCLRSVRLTDIATVGGGDHLRFRVGSGPNTIGCIWFRMGHLMGTLGDGTMANILANASVHRWNGKEEVQLRMIDLELV